MAGQTNLSAEIPADLPEELVQTLLGLPGLRIERIVSLGHTSAEGVWYEGTAQMATAYRARGENDRADEILRLLRAAQHDSGGIAASDQPDGLVTGFAHDDECIRYFQRAHVGATAWMILAERGANPYWMRLAPER